MAPNRGSSAKTSGKKSTQNRKTLGKSAPPSAGSKTRISKTSSKFKAPPPKQQKTKPASGFIKKKRRIYTEKELGVPKLNMITPIGVEKPKGKKKGKVFVDDRESMMTILAMVNADMEGQIESKMMKSRQMEEIREARKKEADARYEERRSKLEDTKDSIRRKRKRRTDGLNNDTPSKDDFKPTKAFKSGRKRVSFA